MSYIVSGLPLEPFRPLFDLSDEALAEQGVIRMIVDAPVGFPCRVTLEDAQPGETVLLLNYEHQSADTPYRSRHAIFISEQARETRRAVGEIPGALRVRTAIALRAYDAAGMMVDAEIASAFMSINAVKAVEIGEGMASAALTGEENADEMRMGNDGRPFFLSNHAGGVLGGISTGQPIVARFAVKPTSSILTPRRSVDRTGAEIELRTKGRHDPCVGIRGVPVGEAMMAIVLADAFLRHRAQAGEGVAWPFTGVK